VRASSSQSNGTLNRREERTYLVIPHETSTEKKLEAFRGEYRDSKNKGKMIAYTEPRAKRGDIKGDSASEVAEGVDAEIIDDMANDLVNDKKSPDGIPRTLFPLRADVLAGYQFEHRGETTVQGRRALKIHFEPVKKSGICINVGGEHENETSDDDGVPCQPWTGEALIDAEELFPIRIDTQLAKGIPWAIRAFLGTNIRQFGFALTYTRVAPGVWFPATYGTEFKLNALWFFKRTLSLSMESSNFRRADASSTIEFDK
jgi:hypothetical protein